jgi:uncharacterized membrane protein YecN with MAPEG domain
MSARTIAVLLVGGALTLASLLWQSGSEHAARVAITIGKVLTFAVLLFACAFLAGGA